MPYVFIGIGSNMGDKRQYIASAMESMKEKCNILKISPLYETEPVGYKSQQWFLNCAAKIQTKLSPHDILEFLAAIEKKLGRVRTINNGPRTIDLVILFYDDEIINTQDLQIPHPRAHERLFVLMPLNDIEPNLMHPVLRKRIFELTESLKSPEEVRKSKIHLSKNSLGK